MCNSLDIISNMSKIDLALLRDTKEKIKNIYFIKYQRKFQKRKERIHNELMKMLYTPQGDNTTDLFQAVNPLKEQVLYETQDKLFSEAHLYKVTDLTADQIQKFFKVLVIDTLFYKKYVDENTYIYDKYKNLYDNLLRLSISKNRKSRQEIIELFRQVKTETERMKEQQII